MKETVYVFGHKNPDTDSVCSAMAYANLKQIIDDTHHYQPIILNPPNKETEFVLNQIGLVAPPVVTHLKPQVKDLDIQHTSIVQADASIKSIFKQIAEDDGRLIPVVGKHEHLIGVVSISDLLPYYAAMEGPYFLKDAATPYENLIRILELEHFHGPYPNGLIAGKVVVYHDTDPDKLTADDVLIIDRATYQSLIPKPFLAGTLIITNVNTPIDKLSENTTLLTSKKGMAPLLKIINQTAPILNVVTKDNLEYFTTYETIDDVKKNMITSRYRRFPVVDEDGYVKGMISKGSLLEASQKKAILVDHNEKGQSIQGIDDITLLEVIDHHRVADIQTMGPLYFRVEPVGCTATIVAKMYEENRVPIERNMALLMLSAIISDTLLFKSPTSTPEDERIARHLAKSTDVDINTYGLSIIYAGSNLEKATPETILTTDVKPFTFGDYKTKIAQTNTSDFDGFYKLYPSTLERMETICKQENLNLFVLLVTDVVIGGTELIAVGADKWIVEQAFGMRPTEQSVYLPDVFSRKKQVVPKLMRAAKL